MRYAQHKGGQKLHIAYELENGLTQPICGKKVDRYIATFNVPLGKNCKNCTKRLNSKAFDSRIFIKKYYE